ncbi:MAG: hypothetical protein J7621_23370 [Niastella sp.]|nr:hypothetical protein [Niastella sp.]
MRQNQFKQNGKELHKWNRAGLHAKLLQAPPAHCLTLHMPEGRKMIFYYAFLLSVELLLHPDHGVMILCFTSRQVVLKGYRLDILFAQYAHGKPGIIQVYNSRYIPPEMNRDPVVIEATVELRSS